MSHTITGRVVATKHAGTRTTSDGTRVAVIREYDGRLTTVTFSDLAQLISEMEEV